MISVQQVKSYLIIIQDENTTLSQLSLVKLSDIVTQIKTVTEEILKFCLKNGCKCVWIGGHSAGAHLAASLLHDLEWQNLMTEQNLLALLKGLVLIAGIYTLRPLLKTSYNGPLQLTEDEINTFSFNNVDTKKLPPVKGMKIVVAVGECDAPKFIEESRHYTQVFSFLQEYQLFIQF